MTAAKHDRLLHSEEPLAINTSSTFRRQILGPAFLLVNCAAAGAGSIGISGNADGSRSASLCVGRYGSERRH